MTNPLKITMSLVYGPTNLHLYKIFLIKCSQCQEVPGYHIVFYNEN